MKMPDFFTSTGTLQFQWSSTTCGSSWSRAFKETLNAGPCPTTPARERASWRDPMETISLMDCWPWSEQGERIQTVILTFRLLDFIVDDWHFRICLEYFKQES